jgi:hypothetical protein
MVDILLCENDLTLKQIKVFKKAEDVQPKVVIQCLKPTLLARTLVSQTRLNPDMFVSSSR